MLADSEKAKYHAALEASNGNIAEAARIAGVPYASFRRHLYNCVELRTRWTKPRVPKTVTDGDAANRTALVPASDRAMESLLPLKTVEELAAEADAALAKGVNQIPNAILTVDEKALATSLHAFQIRHHAAAAQVVHGSLSATAIKMAKALADMVAEYQNMMAQGNLPTHDVGGAKNAPSLLLEAIPKFAAELRKIDEVIGKAAREQLVIEMRQKESNAPQRRGKPGFRPLVAVKVEAGATVKLEGNNATKN